MTSKTGRPIPMPRALTSADGSRHDAAIVIRKNDDRPAFQRWIEYSLARDVEVVAVYLVPGAARNARS